MQMHQGDVIPSSTTEISLSKRLGELITLCKESIEVCALVREFLEESPIILGFWYPSCDDGLEWHREGERHGGPRDAGNIALGSGPRKEASAACPERSLNSARLAPFIG